MLVNENSLMSQSKIKRNDKCPCLSGKKYKVCCLDKDELVSANQRERIIYGDEYSSPELKETAELIKAEFPDHEVIDVSNVANEETYKPLQLQHYAKKVVMLLERNEDNESLFNTRCYDADINYLALYRGAYVTFNTDLRDVYRMVNTRLAGKEWSVY